MSKPRIVFFGNERLATGVTSPATTLRALIEAGYDIAAVVSHNEATTSRKQRSLEVAEVAEEHNIPVLLPAKPSEILDELKAADAVIGVLAAYGKIVPQSVIDVFPHGIINIHPSYLPKHRGPIPIESVILNGEKTTAVSIMRLVKEMDAGPVYGRAEVELKGTESKQELADQLLEIGGTMVVELLPGILDDSLVALPQDDSDATYDELISKADGVLDFSKAAEYLEREIRAYLGWPQSRTQLAGKDVIITAAHAVSSTKPEDPGHVEVQREEGIIMIHTSNGYLCIDKLKPAGKGEMTAKAFLAGYQI